jgi:NAD(P)-dependent dehydrogenase (short-subunit alcohol dehydrogenase family)
VRAVVVTGVSRGLGAALFDAFDARGDRVVAIGRRFTPAQEARRAAEPDRFELLHANLADPPPDLTRLLEGASEAVLVHNAAVVEPIGAVGSLRSADIAAAVAVNFSAPVLLTNAFLAAVPLDASVRILFVSSKAAHLVIDGWSLYCATKAGAEMFFDVVASQLGDRGYVANVDPGQMDTGMQADIRAAAGFFPRRQAWLDAHTEGRLADPAEVAERIVREHLTATGE